MSVAPLAGCLTALVTPFGDDGEVDADGLARLVAFQRAGGTDGVVAAGTTGESPTLASDERLQILEAIRDGLPTGRPVLAGTGSNSTASVLRSTRDAVGAGARYVLVVDPYYNGPSSLEIRREYYEPIAAAFPDVGVVPYVIPGRTGTRLEAADLAELAAQHPNVVAVKDATGPGTFARDVRRLAPSRLVILSGDDGRTAELVADPAVRAEGVVSCLSNVFPAALTESVAAMRSGGAGAERLARTTEALRPLFDLLTIETHEPLQGESRRIRARNPLPLKSMMRVLGMPAGPCRPPLGRLTPAALARLLDGLRHAHRAVPELFDEIESAFGVSVADRLVEPSSWEGVAYAD